MWKEQQVAPQEIHVYPLDDLQDHILTRKCKCNPVLKEQGRIIVHNAYDGREVFEQVGAWKDSTKKTLFRIDEWLPEDFTD